MLPSRSLARPTYFALLALAVTGIVIASPLALRQALKVPGLDWARLSDIGQAYGAVSALVSAVALVTVATSIYFQLRHNQIAKHAAMRMIHLELTKLALEKWPLYDAPFGAIKVPGVHDTRPHTFTNMMMGYLYVEFDTGDLTRDSLRASLSALFDSDVGRQYWRAVRTSWLKAPLRGKSYVTFLAIAEEEYVNAIHGGAPSRTTSNAIAQQNLPPNRPALPKIRIEPLAALAIGACASALALGVGIRVKAHLANK